MFSGLCFMVNEKCVWVWKRALMVRLDPERYDEVMETEGCMPMDFTGKVMKGYVFVDAAALKKQRQLDFWLQLTGV